MGSPVKRRVSCLDIPRAAVVRGCHLEAVIAWCKPRIVGNPPGARSYPLRIITFQPVTEHDFLWIEQARSSIVDLDLFGPYRHLDFATQIDGSAVDDHLPDDDWVRSKPGAR